VPVVVEGRKNNEGEETDEGELSVASLKHQLSTLTSSLYIVTEQKSKMEATYISDRRKMKVTNYMYITDLVSHLGRHLIFLTLNVLSTTCCVLL